MDYQKNKKEAKIANKKEPLLELFLYVWNINVLRIGIFYEHRVVRIFYVQPYESHV